MILHYRRSTPASHLRPHRHHRACLGGALILHYELPNSFRTAPADRVSTEPFEGLCRDAVGGSETGVGFFSCSAKSGLHRDKPGGGQKSPRNKVPDTFYYF